MSDFSRHGEGRGRSFPTQNKNPPKRTLSDVPRCRRVYLAARYSKRELLRGHRATLEYLGFDVQARWLDGDHEALPGPEAEAEAERCRFAEEDWADVTGADIVIAFTEAPRSHAGRGGRHVEFGAALALDRRVIVCGPRENVFHHLRSLEVCADFDDVVSILLEEGHVTLDRIAARLAVGIETSEGDLNLLEKAGWRVWVSSTPSSRRVLPEGSRPTSEGDWRQFKPTEIPLIDLAPVAMRQVHRQPDQATDRVQIVFAGRPGDSDITDHVTISVIDGRVHTDDDDRLRISAKLRWLHCLESALAEHEHGHDLLAAADRIQKVLEEVDL